MFVPEFTGALRKHMITVPEVISKCSGIRVFGKLIKSIVFSTDVAIIRNINADAVIAVYPFTPQPVITHSIIKAADIPVFCGIGGGMTMGKRVVNLARDAEFSGAFGVVVNVPTSNETIEKIKSIIDVPVIATVVSHNEDIEGRLKAGVGIINVSGAEKTPDIVKHIRKNYPEVAIMATGGNSDQTILSTIEAGANAITYTPQSCGQIFRKIMLNYRQNDDE